MDIILLIAIGLASVVGLVWLCAVLAYLRVY